MRRNLSNYMDSISQCGWTSYAIQQIKHLGIALSGDGGEGFTGGYTYNEMVEIWNAANATKSDLIGIWWSPDATHNKLEGSGSDLIPVSFILEFFTMDCTSRK